MLFSPELANIWRVRACMVVAATYRSSEWFVLPWFGWAYYALALLRYRPDCWTFGEQFCFALGSCGDNGACSFVRTGGGSRDRGGGRARGTGDDWTACSWSSLLSPPCSLLYRNVRLFAGRGTDSVRPGTFNDHAPNSFLPPHPYHALSMAG